MKEEGRKRRNQNGNGPENNERKAEYLDEGRAEKQLPAQHGCGPAVVDDMSCLRKNLGGTNIGPIIVDAQFHTRMNDQRDERQAKSTSNGCEGKAMGFR